MKLKQKLTWWPIPKIILVLVFVTMTAGAFIASVSALQADYFLWSKTNRFLHDALWIPGSLLAGASSAIAIMIWPRQGIFQVNSTGKMRSKATMRQLGIIVAFAFTGHLLGCTPLLYFIRPSVKPPVGIEVCPVRHAYLLNGRFINAALTQQLFLRFFPDTPFPVLPSVVVCHSYFLQSELIERAEKSPLIFPKEKTRGLNALNFNFLLSFLVLLGFWLCVCLQRSGLCPTSPRLHARKVRQKRLPVSAPVHYPTAKAGRLSACPP